MDSRETTHHPPSYRGDIFEPLRNSGVRPSPHQGEKLTNVIRTSYFSIFRAEAVGKEMFYVLTAAVPVNYWTYPRVGDTRLEPGSSVVSLWLCSPLLRSN